ncbi:hypothetical protein [Methylobacterium sp. Leaf466]|uniref:hypothetical protein n=1 Tax=Methylobacterium sp. Leaf466 TaxID=1736386 RepID=UPI0006F2C46B|nr:hypothetical protein [Methylobacterium sp. Leaf466]KQT80156.1 hypothetical protein ASG59_19455 [Methylobacterium sp. Leaf466]
MSMLTLVPPAAQPMTADLLHHSLSSEGFLPRYWLMGYLADDGVKPAQVASIEVLLDAEEGARFVSEAEALGKAFGRTRPVCDICEDHGGGPWRLIEALVPRALILELMLLAQRHGCKRMPFPG